MNDNYDYTEQIPFGSTDFADNPEPRCPCILLLDVSGSMSGRPINELNAGLTLFKEELMSDSLAAKRVEVAIVTFGPVEIVNEFQTVENFVPPTLKAQGNTPMGYAIEKALNLLSQRKESYRSNGIAFYRPWVFLITDGEPTDSWKNAAYLVKQGEETKSFAFFAVGVDRANFDILRQISSREPLQLQGLKFGTLFQWLSNSMRSVSRSVPGTEVPLLNPAGPDGWAVV